MCTGANQRKTIIALPWEQAQSRHFQIYKQTAFCQTGRKQYSCYETNNGHWDWNENWNGENENFRAGGIKPFVGKSRAQCPQSNSTERSPKQSLTESSVVCKFIEIQSPLPTGRWVRCDPSSQPTLTQAADIVVLKISLLFLLPARGRGRERGRGKRRAYRAREHV